MNITIAPRLKVGTSDFNKLVTESDLFVDKTLLIHEIIQDASEVLLITRPRRWGKTLNMSMLQYFFTPNIKIDGSLDQELQHQKSQILSKLKISSQAETIEKYFGKYPTIFISFADIRASTFEEMQRAISSLISDLYHSHKYLLHSTILDDEDKIMFRKYLTDHIAPEVIEKGIKRLSEMLYKHFRKKVIILIDEYDKPMNDWYIYKLSCDDHMSENDEHIQNMLNLFSAILGSALKNNNFLEKGIVTGILRIAKASLFSGVNNLKERTILDKEFGQYFGFTEEEVNVLLTKSNIEQNIELIEGIKDWYNGYKIGDYTIYNPWSIMRMIEERGNLEAFWMGTADPSLIQTALVIDTFQEEIQTLIEGGTIKMIADPKMIFSDIHTSPNALHNLLLFAGYLTAVTSHKNEDGISYTCKVQIPNREVRSIYTSSITTWLQTKFQTNKNAYITFVEHLLSGDIEKFIRILKSYLETSASYFDSGEKKAELLYNGFMWGLFASSVNQSYFVEKERETGKGRADLIIIPKSTADHDIAFILEYKVTSKIEDLVMIAGAALEQIKSKNYVSKIKSYDKVKKVMGIGLAFCGGQVEVIYSELDFKP